MWNHSSLASELSAWGAQTMNFLPPTPMSLPCLLLNEPRSCWGSNTPISDQKSLGTEQLFQVLLWYFSGIYLCSLKLGVFHPWGFLFGELSIFLFPRAHASGGMRETRKTQEECNKSKIYEISEVQCARKHVRLWLCHTDEIWQLFYSYNSCKMAQCVYSNITLLYIKYIFQRKHFFFSESLW